MTEGSRAAVLLPLIRKARWQFQRDQYDEPTELYMNYGLWCDLRLDREFAQMIAWASPPSSGPIRLYGMAVGFRDGPLTMIARRKNGMSVRWRIGSGYDEAVVTSDERGAIWAPRT